MCTNDHAFLKNDHEIAGREMKVNDGQGEFNYDTL
jgi:hypothetical protein